MSKIFLMVDSKLDASMDRYLAVNKAIDNVIKRGGDYSVGLNNRVQQDWIITQFEPRATIILCN